MCLNEFFAKLIIGVSRENLEAVRAAKRRSKANHVSSGWDGIWEAVRNENNLRRGFESHSARAARKINIVYLCRKVIRDQKNLVS